MIWIFLVFIFLFHREILFVFLKIYCSAFRVEEDQLPIVQVKARMRERPQVYFMRNSSAEAFSFHTLFGLQFFVAEKFWNKLTADQQEILLCWAVRSAKIWPLFWRLCASENPRVIDRDIALSHPKAHHWSQVLDKCVLYLTEESRDSVGSFLSGLSPLGTAWFSDLPPVTERQKDFAQTLERFLKAEVDLQQEIDLHKSNGAS